MGAAEEADYSIKPENATPAIPTSEWPLLLRNYDKCTSPNGGGGLYTLLLG